MSGLVSSPGWTKGWGMMFADTMMSVLAILEETPLPRPFPKPLTPQYYLSTPTLCDPASIRVIITESDFLAALKELTPSVSEEEMRHYGDVQKKFAGETLNSEEGRAKGKMNGVNGGDVKGKGKANDTD